MTPGVLLVFRLCFWAIKGFLNFMEFFSSFVSGCAISLLSNKGVIAPIRVRILIMVNCDV